MGNGELVPPSICPAGPTPNPSPCPLVLPSLNRLTVVTQLEPTPSEVVGRWVSSMPPERWRVRVLLISRLCIYFQEHKTNGQTSVFIYEGFPLFLTLSGNYYASEYLTRVNRQIMHNLYYTMMRVYLSLLLILFFYIY